MCVRSLHYHSPKRLLGTNLPCHAIDLDLMMPMAWHDIAEPNTVLVKSHTNICSCISTHLQYAVHMKILCRTGMCSLFHFIMNQWQFLDSFYIRKSKIQFVPFQQHSCKYIKATRNLLALERYEMAYCLYLNCGVCEYWCSSA